MGFFLKWKRWSERGRTAVVSELGHGFMDNRLSYGDIWSPDPQALWLDGRLTGVFFFFHSKVMDIWWKWMTLQTERTRSPNLCVPLNYFNQVHAAMTNRVWQLSNSATYFGSESGSLMVIIGWVRQTHTWKSAGVNQSHRVCFLD